MNAEEAPAPSYPVQVQRFVLTNVAFQRADELPEGERSVDGQVSLTAHEPSDEGQVTVDLTVQMQDKEVFRVAVTYAVVLQKVGSFSDIPALNDDVSDAEAWDMVAQQVVPIVAYPYAREMITSLFQKADLPVNIPPIVDWSQATVTGPEPPDESESKAE